MKPHWLISVLILLCFSAAAQQTSQTGRRPKIGVALQGGGAKGLAHIGVLEWFEEHRIPIDYIAGTSMGGLVGGLYATGVRPAEIQQLIKTIDWDEVLRGEIPYQDLSFRRKEDLRAYPNSLELGLRHGIQVPGGLNSGHQVTLILDRFSLPYSSLKSFDDLPIPFRCVATEMVTQKQEVFKGGSLAEALRSSMSLPAVFTPVRNDGKVYVDGGLLNNLPTNVVKQMGADIVIGIHLSTGPVDPETTRSLFGVMGQSVDVMINANVFRGMEMSDILITVDVSGYTALDFKRSEEIPAKGYEAAAGKANVLSTLALDDESWQQHLAQRESRRVRSVPSPRFVEVEGTNPQRAQDIQRSLKGYLGQPIDTSKLENDLTRLTGSGLFNRIGYGLTSRAGKEGLLISTEEKDYAPPFFKPGFHVGGSDVENVRFSLGARVTFIDVGGHRSEWRNDFSLGSISSIGTEYYHPLTPEGRWFIAPRASASSSAFDIYFRNDLLAEYRLNQSAFGLDVGHGIDRFSEIRLGYEAGYLNASPRLGNPSLGSPSGRTGATSIRYALDRLDSPVIPRRGVRIQVNLQWVDASPGALRGFPSAEASFAVFQPVSKPASVYMLASGGTTFGRDQVGFPQFSLGGPSRLAAYGLNEFLTNQYFLFRLGFLHRLAQLPPFLGRGIYFNSLYELGKAYRTSSISNLPNDVAVGIETDTVLGPAFVGVSIGDTGHRKVFFQLGRFF
ncbi:MAG TPA: patatin-like phospholipase family protein [Phycisphaerae bacterium]|nr:patatin-like phospholipase family protein [Phycisphaerae bacterium]